LSEYNHEEDVIAFSETDETRRSIWYGMLKSLLGHAHLWAQKGQSYMEVAAFRNDSYGCVDMDKNAPKLWIGSEEASVEGETLHTMCMTWQLIGTDACQLSDIGDKEIATHDENVEAIPFDAIQIRAGVHPDTENREGEECLYFTVIGKGPRVKYAEVTDFSKPGAPKQTVGDGVPTEAPFLEYETVGFVECRLLDFCGTDPNEPAAQAIAALQGALRQYRISFPLKRDFMTNEDRRDAHKARRMASYGKPVSA